MFRAVSKCERTLLAGLIVGLSLATSSALAQESKFNEVGPDVLSAARSEGQVVVYTADPEDTVKAWVTGFNARYPDITVNWIRISSAAMFARFAGEVAANARTADVVSAGSTAIYQKSPDFFLPLSEKLLPNLAVANLVKANNDRYVIEEVQYHQVTYNTDRVSQQDLKDHLATWEGLADPFWKDKLVLNDPTNSTTYTSWLGALHAAYGDDWVKRFMANNPMIANGGLPTVQSVGAGATLLGFPTTGPHSAGLRAQGAPLAMYQPGGPVHGTSPALAISALAPHSNAAAVWINWMLGPDAQKVVCNNRDTPVRDDIGCGEVIQPNTILSDDAMPQDKMQKLLSLVGR